MAACVCMFQNQQKKRAQGVRLVEEPLKLFCPWNDCKILYTDYREFIKHINTHAQKAEINEDDSKFFSWFVGSSFHYFLHTTMKKT